MSNSQSEFSGNQQREKTTSKQYLRAGAGFLFGALVLFVIWLLIQVPPEYKTFLFIPYAVNPDYVMVVMIRFIFAITTILFSMFGLLLLILGFATHISNKPKNNNIAPPLPT